MSEQEVKRHNIPRFELPDHLLEAETVALIYDEVEGLTFLAEYGLVEAAFDDPALLADRDHRRAVVGYLNDDSVSPLPFRRLGQRQPEKASRVFQRLLKKPAAVEGSFTGYPSPGCATAVGTAYCQAMTTRALSGEPVDVGADIVTLFQRLLRRLRAEVDGLDRELLVWRPAADTTPISNLVLHVIGALGVHFSVLVGSPQERDREAEFQATPLSAAELVERLDAAERDLESYRDTLSEADLLAWRERPARGLTASGLVVLLVAYGHAAEHLAQVSLTRQLYDSRRGGA